MLGDFFLVDLVVLVLKDSLLTTLWNTPTIIKANGHSRPRRQLHGCFDFRTIGFDWALPHKSRYQEFNYNGYNDHEQLYFWASAAKEMFRGIWFVQGALGCRSRRWKWSRIEAGLRNFERLQFCVSEKTQWFMWTGDYCRAIAINGGCFVSADSIIRCSVRWNLLVKWPFLTANFSRFYRFL